MKRLNKRMLLYYMNYNKVTSRNLISIIRLIKFMGL